MSKTLLRHTLTKHIFDIAVDFLIFIHFHFMKIHKKVEHFDRCCIPSLFDIRLVNPREVARCVGEGVGVENMPTRSVTDEDERKNATEQDQYD